MNTECSIALAIIAACASLTSAQAAQIFYESFETPVVAGKTDGVPTGWTNNPARVYKSGLQDTALTGKTGDQFAFVDDYSSQGSHDGYLLTTSAILSSNLAAYIHYTLTCDVTGKSTSDTIAIDLIAGSTVVASVTDSIATVNNLSAKTSQLEFMAESGHANLGETLAIKLRMVAGNWDQDCYFDNLSLDAVDAAADATAPTPDPMTWVQTPTAAGSNSVLMTCSTASDANWVQYFFTNTVNGNNSGWIEVTTWRDTGLTDGVTYSYKVKARDKSPNHNETVLSSEESATCNANILFYDSFEYPIVGGTQSGTNPENWVDVSPTGNRAGLGYLQGTAWTNTAGDQAVWLNVYNAEPVLETTTAILATNLVANSRYALTFNAADNTTAYTVCADLLAGTNVVLTTTKAPGSQNFAANVASNAVLPLIGDPGIGEALKLRVRVTYTGYPHSNHAYLDNLLLVAEPSSADVTAPTPDPMTWVQKPTPAEGNGMYMVCSVATDPNYVAYMFSNTVNGTTSGWIDEPIWRDSGLTDGVSYSYKVMARDKSVNSNETAFSSEESATADSDIIFYESFEYPVISSAYTGTDPEDWDDTSPSGNRAGLGDLDGSDYSNFEGDQAAWLNVYNAVPVLQSTSANFTDVFVPSCDYTLQFDGAANSTYGLYADLLAGTNVVMTAQVSANTKNFSSHFAQQNFSSSLDDAGIGEALKVRLRVTGGAWNYQSYIDNLSLSGVRTNAIWNRYAENITDQAADMVGILTATGVNVYVSAYWGTTDEGTSATDWAYTNHLGWYNSVDFIYLTNTIASGLMQGTEYYYSFRGSNAAWEVWDSTSGVFATVGPPIVDNATGATPVSATTAMIRGELTDGALATAWICWGGSDFGTESTSDWGNVVSIGSIVQDVSFSTLAAGLTTNATYFYRCYVTNSTGDDWSDDAETFGGTPFSDTDGSVDPVDGAYFEWDASKDAGGDDSWPSTTANAYTWTFDAGSQTPVDVSDARLDVITKAYAFPGALNETNLQWDAFASANSATFEFVLDTDTDDGMIFETGGTGDGIKFEIVGGDLRGMIAESTDVIVTYTLTATEKNRFMHVVYVADNVNDLFQLYVDGSLRNSQVWSLGDDWSGGNLAGFGGGNTDEPDNVDPGDFVGKIALFRFYQKAFTVEEVLTNFNALSSSELAISAEFYLNAGQDDGANSTWEDLAPGQPTGFDAILDTSPAVSWGAAASALPGITHAYTFPGGNTGVVGGATLADSTGESFTYAADGDWTTNDVSFEIWFRPADLNTASNNGEILFEDGGGTGIGFFMNDNLLQFRKMPGDGLVSHDVTGLESEFIQAVGTYDVSSDDLELFVNGEFKGATTAAGGDWSGSDGAALGCRGDANAGGIGNGDSDTTGFDGEIAIFRAYRDRILTSSQIMMNYNSVALLPGRIANLAPTNITYKQAVLNGSLTAETTNYTVYVHWGSSDAGPDFSWDSSAPVGTNLSSTNISYTVSGLTGGVTNWYTFRATNDSTNMWATPSWMFVTLPGGAAGSVFMFR